MIIEKAKKEGLQIIMADEMKTIIRVEVGQRAVISKKVTTMSQTITIDKASIAIVATLATTTDKSLPEKDKVREA